MPIFDYRFTVNASVEAVRDLHRDTYALKKLTPPPTYVQMKKVEPMAEGSVSQFTLWMGPLPIHWKAIHHDVTDNGFQDEQAEGPAKSWRHTHSFVRITDHQTEIREHIEYEHGSGFWGVVTRLLFAKANLYLMFTYRKFATRWFLSRAKSK